MTEENGKFEKDTREIFLSLLNHDLVNRFRNIFGYGKLLRDTNLSQRQESLLGKIMKEIDRGRNRLEKVKTLKKLDGEEKGKIELFPVILEAIKENKDLAAENDMEIVFEDFEEGIFVKAGILLGEVISNLVENSIIHSEGNKVRIDYENLQNHFRIIIEDDGKGISEKEKEEIFDCDLEKNNVNSCMGMYLVKKILGIYGGDFEVGDSRMGGARFEILLEKY